MSAAQDLALQLSPATAVAPATIVSIVHLVARWGVLAVPATLLALRISRSEEQQIGATAALLAVGTALALAGLMSFAVYEDRPFVTSSAPNLLGHVADSSFPSGHAALMTAAAASLLMMRRPIAACIVAFATLAVSASLIWAGAHYVQDVLAGGCLGLLTAWTLRRPFCRGFVLHVSDMVAAIVSPLDVPGWTARLRSLVDVRSGAVILRGSAVGPTFPEPPRDEVGVVHRRGNVVATMRSGLEIRDAKHEFRGILPHRDACPHGSERVRYHTVVPRTTHP